MMTALRHAMTRLRKDTSGLALLEFAYALPIFMVLCLSGAELTNYTITRMRISQIALQLADNAARIGDGSMLQAKTISEKDVNDILIGAGLLAGEKDLDLYGRGRVIISSLEPMANPNTTSKYKIGWQRCRGSKTGHGSTYGVVGQASGQNMTGMGPAGHQIIAPEDGGAMFVEVYYEYSPLFDTELTSMNMVEVASMLIRDRRDMTQIYPSAGVTASTC